MFVFGKHHYLAFQCMNALFLFYRWKKIKLDELMLQVCFLGGFFLHLLVEAKSQYVLMFYVLIIPLMVKGVAELLGDVKLLLYHRKISRKLILFLVALIGMILIIQLMPVKLFDILFKIEKDTHLLYSDMWY